VVALNDVNGTADGGGVGQGGAAELVHVRCAALSWHRIGEDNTKIDC